MTTFDAPSMFGFPAPNFPSYSLPGLENFSAEIKKPAGALAWGGLSSSPALQYLVRPPAAQPIAASVGAGSLNGFIDLAKIPTRADTNGLTASTNSEVTPKVSWPGVRK